MPSKFHLHIYIYFHFYIYISRQIDEEIGYRYRDGEARISLPTLAEAGGPSHLVAMQTSISVAHTVQFSETDMAGLVHFSNYLRYAERAEAALFQAWDFPLITTPPDEMRGFPRVRAKCRYLAPLDFGDDITITITLVAATERALDWKFRIHKDDPAAPVEVADGEMRTVYAQRPPDGSLQTTTLPPDFYAKLQAALANK